MPESHRPTAASSASRERSSWWPAPALYARPKNLLVAQVSIDYINTISPEGEPLLPRQRGHRAQHPPHDPLERCNHGEPGQQGPRRNRWSPSTYASAASSPDRRSGTSSGPSSRVVGPSRSAFPPSTPRAEPEQAPPAQEPLVTCGVQDRAAPSCELVEVDRTPEGSLRGSRRDGGARAAAPLRLDLRSILWSGIDGSSALRFTRADRTIQPAAKPSETTSHSCRKSTDPPSAT